MSWNLPRAITDPVFSLRGRKALEGPYLALKHVLCKHFFSNSCFSRYLISTLIFFFWDKLWVAKLASDHLTASPKQAALHITWESVTTAIGGDPCSHPNGFTSAWGVWFTLVLSSLLLLQFPVPGTSFPLSLDNHLFFSCDIIDTTTSIPLPILRCCILLQCNRVLLCICQFKNTRHIGLCSCLPGLGIIHKNGEL